MTDHDTSQPGGEVLFHQTEDGQTRLETRMMGETEFNRMIDGILKCEGEMS